MRKNIVQSRPFGIAPIRPLQATKVSAQCAPSIEIQTIRRRVITAFRPLALTPILLVVATLLPPVTLADEVPQWTELFNGQDLTGWVDVNTSPETWSVKDGLLVCSGHPIGVMRSEKQYENFILHIEW